jgi:hypothetical protein
LRIIKNLGILVLLEAKMFNVKCIHEVSGVTWGQVYQAQDMANGKIKIFDNSGSVVWIDARCFDAA